jgi:hypothetical protein
MVTLPYNLNLVANVFPRRFGQKLDADHRNACEQHNVRRERPVVVSKTVSQRRGDDRSEATGKSDGGARFELWT